MIFQSTLIFVYVILADVVSLDLILTHSCMDTG